MSCDQSTRKSGSNVIYINGILEEYTYDSGKLSSSSVIFEPIWLLLHSCPFPHLKCQRLFIKACFLESVHSSLYHYFSIAACKKKTSGIQGKSPRHLSYRFRYPWGPWGLRFSPWGLRFSPWDLRSLFLGVCFRNTHLLPSIFEFLRNLQRPWLCFHWLIFCRGGNIQTDCEGISYICEVFCFFCYIDLKMGGHFAHCGLINQVWFSIQC